MALTDPSGNRKFLVVLCVEGASGNCDVLDAYAFLGVLVGRLHNRYESSPGPLISTTFSSDSSGAG